MLVREYTIVVRVAGEWLAGITLLLLQVLVQAFDTA